MQIKILLILLFLSQFTFGQEQVTFFKENVQREFSPRILGEFKDKVILTENSETVYYLNNSEKELREIKSFPKNVNVVGFFVLNDRPYFVVSQKLILNHISEIWSCDATFQNFKLEKEIVNEVRNVVKLDSSYFIYSTNKFYKIKIDNLNAIKLDTIKVTESEGYQVLDNKIINQIYELVLSSEGPYSIRAYFLLIISSNKILKIPLPKNLRVHSIELLKENYYYVKCISNSNQYQDFTLDLKKEDFQKIDKPYSVIQNTGCHANFSSGDYLNTTYLKNDNLFNLIIQPDTLNKENCSWAIKLFTVTNNTRNLILYKNIDWQYKQPANSGYARGINKVMSSVKINDKFYFTAASLSISILGGSEYSQENDNAFFVSFDLLTGKLDTLKLSIIPSFYSFYMFLKNDAILHQNIDKNGLIYHNIFNLKTNNVSKIITNEKIRIPIYEGELYNYKHNINELIRESKLSKFVELIKLPNLNVNESTIIDEKRLENYLFFKAKNTDSISRFWLNDGKTNNDILKEFGIFSNALNYKISNNKIQNKYLILFNLLNEEYSVALTFDVVIGKFDLISKFDKKLIQEYSTNFNYHKFRNEGLILDLQGYPDVYISASFNTQILLPKPFESRYQRIVKVFPNGNIIVSEPVSKNELFFMQFPFKTAIKIFAKNAQVLSEFGDKVLCVSDKILYSIDESGQAKKVNIDYEWGGDFRNISDNEVIFRANGFVNKMQFVYYLNIKTLKIIKLYESKSYPFLSYLGKNNSEHLFYFKDKIVTILNTENHQMKEVTLPISNINAFKVLQNRIVITGVEYAVSNLQQIWEYKNEMFTKIHILNSSESPYFTSRVSYFDKPKSQYAFIDFSKEITNVTYQNVDNYLGNVQYYSDSMSLFSLEIFNGGYSRSLIGDSYIDYSLVNKASLKSVKPSNVVSYSVNNKSFIYFSKNQNNQLEYNELTSKFELENKTSQAWIDDEVVKVEEPFIIGNAYFSFATSKKSGRQLWKLASFVTEKAIVLGNTTEIDDSVVLFPNPSSTEMMIRFKENQTEPVNFTIFDISGKIILNGQTSSNQTIDIGRLSKGVHLINLDLKTTSKTIRFVKL